MQAAAGERQLSIQADRPGERLDTAVARLCPISRSQTQRLIEAGLVTVAGQPRRKAGERLEGGELLVVRLPPPVEATPQPEAIPLDVVYEDAHLIVVNKPAGMAVHPGPGHAGRTLVNALLAHCPDLPGIGGVQRPGIVHRLDKDTSGLIVAAKDERSHNGLAAQLKNRQVKKTYLALVEGRLEPVEALIDAPVGRDPNNRRRMMVRPQPGSGESRGGREARTTYRVQTYFESATLVEASPITGRTHQIRVHFAALGHAVVGDPVYGRPSTLVLPRQFLHAWRLAFRHPVDGRDLAFEAPLPDELERALGSLTNAPPGA